MIWKGVAPSGASVVWRSRGWRPYFFVQVEALSLSDKHVHSIREALAQVGKLDSIDQVHVERVLAPRLLPFAYDPANPRGPKQLAWLKVSFPTVQAKKKAARFLLDRDTWSIHPRLFMLPFEIKRQGFYLAEHTLDEAKMIIKTMQININTWLTIAHDAVRFECSECPRESRASIAQFEWIVPEC